MKKTLLIASLKNWFVGLTITVVALFFVVHRSYAQSASTITVVGTSTVNSIQNATATFVDPGLVISANGTIEGFRVIITSSFTSGDELNYTGTLPSGISASPFNTTTKSLNFNGTTTAENWQALLRTVRIQTTSATCFPESRQVTFVAGGALFNPLNNHYYMISPSTQNWPTSKTNAENLSLFGLQGYLATITSSAENSFISVLVGNNSWLGGSDDYSYINSAVGYNLYANQAASEGKFYWVTGPEKGTQLTSINGNSGWLPSTYSNWYNGEPNNAGPEHCVHIYSSIFQWNDLPETYVTNAVYEFGGMPNDVLNSTIKYTRNIYVNGAPTSGISGGGVNVCASTGTTTLTINSFSGNVIRWESSLDNFISGTGITTISSTNASLIVNNPAQTTYYRAVVNVGNCPSQATSPVAINVTSTVTGNLNSTNSTICTGGTVVVNLFGNNGSVLNWESGSSATGPWTNISNTSTTLSQTLSTSGTVYYRAKVQSTCGGAAYTGVYPITVNSGTPPVGGSVNNVTACDATVSGNLTLSGYTGSISKWQNSSDGVVWADLASNTSTTQSYTALNSQKYYRAVLTNGSCGTAYSTGGFINFNAYFSGAMSALVSTTSQMTATNIGGTWSSSNTTVATVSSTGLVTAQGTGIANITYTNVGSSCTKTFTVNTYTCGAVESRNNGSSQASTCPGVGGAISTNFTSTTYATVPSTTKTGDLYLNWVAGIPTDNAGNKIVPAISQIYMNGFSSITQAGPAGTAVTSGGSGFKSPYCFYSQNLPTSGTYTLRLVNPINGITLNTCTYVGSTQQTNSTTTTPTLSQNTNPTFSTTSSTISSSCAGVSNGPVAMTVQDAQSSLNTLVLTASSSNTTLLPNANIAITQPNTSGAASFNYTPVVGQAGSSIVTFTLTDEQGLTATTTVTINVTASTISDVSNAVNDLACGSTASGSLTTTITGGTGYTYQWSWSTTLTGTYSTTFSTNPVAPSPSVSPTNLMGDYYYRLTVTDGCGTTINSTPVQLNSVTAMTITATPSANTCIGLSNGTITVTTTGGGTSQVATAVSGSNTYTQSVSTFSSPNRTFVLSNLPAGIYTVSVSDANSSCISSTSSTITQQAAPLTILGDGCINKTSLSSTSGQTSYTWYKDNVAISGATSNTYAPTSNGDYKVQISNGTCASMSTSTTISTCGVNADGSMIIVENSTTLVDRNGTINSGKGVDQRGLIVSKPFYAPAIITNGLVLYLDAGNSASYPGTGTTWTDLSSSANVGTFVGGTSYSSSDGGTILFNGNSLSNDYVSVANNASLNLTTAGSISMWIKPNSLTQLGLTNLISRTIDGAPNGQSYYIYWTGGNITGIIQNGGVYKSISTPVPTAIGWYNYVFTWGNGYLNLYQNGVSVATPIASSIIAQTLSTTVNIGGYVFGGAGGNANTFNGKIPFVTLYNREITPAEVLTNFNAVKTRYGL